MFKTVISEALHLWHFNVDQFNQSDLQLLSEEEQNQSLRYSSEKTKVQFLATRIKLRQILSQYTNSQPRDLIFSKNEFGKPSLASNAAEIKFNLSHSAGQGVLAVSSGANVGVDIESIKRKTDWLGVASKSFASQEYDQLLKASVDELPTKFFEYWTLKEAFIKAVGRGLGYGLDQFWFEIDGSSAQIYFKSKATESEHYEFKILRTDEFIIAVATEKIPNPTELIY